MANKKNDVRPIQQSETEESAAGLAGSSGTETSDFIYYPTNKVVGIIDDPDDAEAAVSDLEAAGFTADEIEILTGQ